MTELLARFAFPASCRVDQRVPKTLFAESEVFEAADRRLFAKAVEEVRCAYVLDAAKAKLVAQADGESDWSCLAVIAVALRETNHAERIAELIHKAMPYPLLVVLSDGEVAAFSLAEKRLSRDGRETTVLERQVATLWHAADALDAFFAAADFGRFDGRSFRELYRWLWARVEALDAADVTGAYSVAAADPEKRRAALAEIRALDLQIAELRRQAKGNLPLAEKIALNVKIKALQRAREAAKEGLA